MIDPLEVVPGDHEIDQDGMAIGRDRSALRVGRGDVGHELGSLQVGDALPDGRLERRIACPQVGVLHDHRFVVRPHARVLQCLLGPAGFSGELLCPVDLVLGDRVADQDRDNHESQPAPDGSLAVVRTPVGSAGCKIAPRQRRFGAGLVICRERVGLAHQVPPSISVSTRRRIGWERRSSGVETFGKNPTRDSRKVKPPFAGSQALFDRLPCLVVPLLGSGHRGDS